MNSASYLDLFLQIKHNVLYTKLHDTRVDFGNLAVIIAAKDVDKFEGANINKVESKINEYIGMEDRQYALLSDGCDNEDESDGDGEEDAEEEEDGG